MRDSRLRASAAFANGCLIRHTDFNDNAPGGHNSDLITAALAVGEALHSTGAEVMTAITIGYELKAVPAGGESVAAAMTAGKLMKLDEDRLANAVGMALIPHVALNKGVGALSMWKGVRTAEATKCGVWSALMAREGMTGPPQPFEGRGSAWADRGPGRAFTLPDQAELSIERTWAKRFPSDAQSQGVLVLLPQIRSWTSVDDIESIQYDMTLDNWQEVGSAPKWDPRNRETADHSLPYLLARGLMDGDIYIDSFKSEKIYAGPHNLKLGWQMYQTRSVGGGWSVYTPEGYGLRAVFRNGVPDSVNTYNTPTKSVERSRDHGVYLQDNWRPINKLTLNLGVRFQTGHGWIDTPLCQQATPFIAGQCFDHPTGVPLWKNFVPRASAIYDVFGNGRTAVKVSANRYLIPLGVTVIGRLDPISLQNDTRSWTDRNRDLIPQLDELGPSTGFNLGTTNRYVDHLRQPIVNELSTEFQQQLPGQVVVSAGYYYRGHRDMIGSTNVAVPRESYTPITVTEVVSGRRVTVYNQDPATLGKFDVVWSNQPEQNRSFHGVDLTIRKSMARRWMMMGSASWGKSDIDIAGTVDLNNPNFTFRRGPESNERPFFLKVSSAYQAPLGVTVAANFQHYVGLPETTTAQVTSATVRLTQVNQTLVVDPVGTIRQPDVSLVDLNVQRPFTLGKMRLDPRIDVFNLPNSSGITSYVAQLGPSYGRAIEVIGGRLIKFGVNFNF